MSTAQVSLGIDVGSTTAKVVILDADGTILFSDYRRHNADPLAALQSILREAHQRLGDLPLNVLLTGSAGLGIAEKFGLPFVQEVVASAEVIHRRYPQVHTLIDIGGEDAKIIFFDEHYPPDIRMNGSCAGGTGAFIDEMATLLNVPVTEIDGLARRSTTTYPMASRCGVFAKTDLQNLLARQIAKEDIAASVFQAVVMQILATLARGRDPLPAVLFSGGPFTFMPALKNAFLKALVMTPDQVVEAESPQLLPALGAALTPDKGRMMTLQSLLDVLSVQQVHASAGTNRLEPLFSGVEDLAAWKENGAQHRVARADLETCKDGETFLGVDSGSTTTKVVLVDAQGRVVFGHYAGNGGDAVSAVRAGLVALRDAFAGHGFLPRIARAVVTGYGEDLIRAAFGMDSGMVETLAHFRAARAFDPQVTFILDIGGQDMKAIFVQDGQIQNIEINEACSSGCGSFIESFARVMGYGVADFAGLACSAEAPFNLGTRCTVFMNSRVKQALREGAGINDISAGLAYSVIKNALYKVLKITGTEVLGEHVVVQGGTFRNPAVQKALEKMIGRPVVCPDLAELMGAYGAALTARDVWNPGDVSAFVGLDAVDDLGAYTRRDIHCRGCENRCSVTKLIFPNGNAYFSGNRCEKIYTNGGRAEHTGVNLPARKYELLFGRRSTPDDEPLLTLGIPRVLNIFENYPFWNTLFVESSIAVHLSAPSSSTLYQDGAKYVMSENLCFPGKLVTGHIIDLVKAGVDRIFYPMVFYEKDEFSDAGNTYNCPVVSGYPDVIRSAIDPQARFDVPLDAPPVTFRDEGLLHTTCLEYLTGLGVPRRRAEGAFRAALRAQEDFKASMVAMGEDVLEDAGRTGRPVVLLMGRPYHIDPLINHSVPEILADFGVDVLTEDSIPTNGAALNNRHVMTQWEYLNRYFYAARWVGEQENVELVQLNSFGCGPDPFILDEVRAILGEYGKKPTVIRIDEIESAGSTRLRLRSMIESWREDAARREGGAEVRRARRVSRRTTRPYSEEDRERTLIVPDFSPFCSPPIVRPFVDLGYQIVQLPPADHTTVDVGLKYTNNEICYPGIITLGDIIKALQSGKYDLKRTAVGFSQTGGQCRASSYPSMIKKALVAAGFENVPVVTLSTSLSTLNDQPGFRFDTKQYIYRSAVSMMFTDALSDMYHSSVVREKEKGSAQALVKRYLDDFMTGVIPTTRKALLGALRRAVTDFNALPSDPAPRPKVGIVGEIYVKYNAFSNNYVAQWLMDQGIEVVMPSFFEFFDGGMISNDNAVHTNIRRRNLNWLVTTLGQKLGAVFQRQFDSVMQEYHYYNPRHNIQEVAERAKRILSLNHQYGEGWLIAGEIASFARDGVNNVLCLQPFGCIANHVIAKGVQKKIQETFPQMNVLFLDADAGISEVNFFNRMHFFVSHVRNGHVESAPEDAFRLVTQAF